ncbi:hypothetical protein GCM10027403_29480 [Arthrobacter tecti]|uniref:Putative nucleic-acid-binding Zn-ribbon protein n=1 Tax=Arthrobacter pigmenti TaxID=271432 RepID=A0A846RM12_9MICC|nr:hypothetical protein [Arthrobacter pigmenti]NJC22149.1 putative nucleic-acid-binding Zn-ribbon protein [Arthrobacter pigmenti]
MSGESFLGLEVKGYTFKCLVCQNPEFTQRDILLNTAGLTAFDMDWANKSSDGAICTDCGYIHEFAYGSNYRWVRWKR